MSDERPGERPDRPILARLAGSEALAGHAGLQRYVQCFLDTFLVDGRLDPRLRELAILRIAWGCGQPFEWASHHRLARRIGLTDDDILAVRVGPTASGFAPPEAAALAAADEVVTLGRITAETLARCRAALGDADDLVLELVHLLAGYRMMATILETSPPSLADAGLTLWPPDGVGPTQAG